MKKIVLFLIILLPVLTFSQTTVTGKVTNSDDGSAIPGATVLVKGTSISVLTDFDGKYSINVPANSDTLEFSFAGMETYEMKINGKNIINVQLEYSQIEVEDVVVTSLAVKRDYKIKPSNRKTGYTQVASYPVTQMDYDVPDPSNEGYSEFKDNNFMFAMKDPKSTFSIDVDNAAYSNIRRFLNSNMMPPVDAVRIEEMINYFYYDYPNPTDQHPFSVTTEIAEAPWNTEHQLIHIGIQGKKIDYIDLKPSNLVFLIDVSGSMGATNKLPLIKDALKLLVKELSKNDYVSIVVYAGAAGTVLPPTSAKNQKEIFEALDRLASGGSTAGAAGIKLAYEEAQKNLIQDGNNRVILVTDGDFNVGVTDNNALVDLITEYRTKYDIYLTICGVGMGNYKDDRMEQISNAGNGNYFYIDNMQEAEKVFVKDLRANMFTIAKDVKIQVAFNPKYVRGYRLIGYVNRVMDNEDFDDDKKDAGELGAGHTVTAMYEIIPVGSSDTLGQDFDQQYIPVANDTLFGSDDIMNLKLRYKPIKSDVSTLIQQSIVYEKGYLQNSTDIFKFSAAVAAFGMLLRQSEYISNFSYDDVLRLAKDSYKRDDQYQTEFLTLVQTAKRLNASK